MIALFKQLNILKYQIRVKQGKTVQGIKAIDIEGNKQIDSKRYADNEDKQLFNFFNGIIL